MQEDKIIKAKIYSNLERPIRWNGIIDYKTLITVVVYIFLTWNIAKLFTASIFIQIYIVLILTVPFVVFIKAYINEKDITFMLVIIIRFYFKPRLYAYDIFLDDLNFIYDYENKMIECRVGSRMYKLKCRKHKK